MAHWLLAFIRGRIRRSHTVRDFSLPSLWAVNLWASKGLITRNHSSSDCLVFLLLSLHFVQTKGRTGYIASTSVLGTFRSADPCHWSLSIKLCECCSSPNAYDNHVYLPYALSPIPWDPTTKEKSKFFGLWNTVTRDLCNLFLGQSRCLLKNPLWFLSWI